MFTNLFIHREEFGENYAYDSNRNVVSVSTLSGQKSAMQYDSAHNLKSYRQPGAPDSAKYTLNFGSSLTEQKRHLLRESATPMGQRDAFSYDTYGNLRLPLVRNPATGLSSRAKAPTPPTATIRRPPKTLGAMW